MINKYSIVAYRDGGVELDTSGEQDISLNYQIDDILDITKRNTSFSKTIKLPGTPTNNKFFKQIFDVNIDSVYFNPLKRIPVAVRVGSNDVMNGYLQLMNILIDNGEVEYEVSIAGSLKNIITQIDQYYLSNLDLSEYNHIRNQSNIITSWDYNVSKWGTITSVGGPGDGYVYPYIVNGNSDDIWRTAYIYDLFPAIYVKTIIDKMFEFVDYTYTSEFFESEYFKKLILPFNSDKLQLSEEEFNNRTVAVGISGGPYLQITPWRQNNTSWYYNSADNYKLQLTRESGTVNDSSGELEFTDIDGQWNSYNYFTCANSGYYDVDFVGKAFLGYKHSDGNNIEWNANSLEFIYYLELVKNNGSVITLASSNGTQLITPSDGASHASPWYDIANPIPMNMNAQGVAMDVGDRIRIRFGHRHPGIVNWNGTDSKISSAVFLEDVQSGEYTKFVIKPSSNDSTGNELIDMNQILDKKIKMKDFFLNILKMFNLVVQDNPNKPNDVIIEPRDNFYKSRQKVLDWDAEKKLDNDSTVKITPMSEIDFKTYTFTYAEDSDWLNQEYTDETNRIYGDYQIVIDNDFSDKESKLELMFAATPDGQQFIDSKVAPFFASYEDEEFRPKKVKPRILFYGGTLDLYSGSALYIKDFEGDPSYTTVTRYPYVGMWDHPYEPQYDLAFGRTQKIYWNSLNTFPNQNLFEMFHKQTMQNIIDPNSRLLECKVYLTPRDIAEFDFRDIVFLLGSYWRVNLIKDYNPVQTDRLTTVILYKIVDIDVIDRYTVEVPTSNKSCPTDMVSKRDKKTNRYIVVSQSGQEVTEDCCKQVGGTFTNGICYVRPFKPTPIGIEATFKTKMPFISGGIDVVPISDKDGPISKKKNQTSRNTLGVNTRGSNNYVPEGADSNGVIIGSNSTILKDAEGVVVIGDGITGSEAGTIYIGDIKIGQDGNIRFNGLSIIDGGEDEVMEVTKTNFIDVVDGTFDAVRNTGGDSKARPMIDANIEDKI